MREGETTQEHELVSKLGKLRLSWELYRPNFGNTIAIQTGETGCPVLLLNIPAPRQYDIFLPDVYLQLAAFHSHAQTRFGTRIVLLKEPT